MVARFAPNKPEQEGRPALAHNLQKELEEPTPAQITKAVEFLNNFLDNGPQLTRNVEQVARQQGHAKRTLDRARALLGVQKLPPEQFRGPWRIALKDDPAVSTYKKRKDAKHQEARQRKGNERKRRNQSRGSRDQQTNLVALVQ